MQQLREQGIYTPPDGGEFVAHVVFDAGVVLYTPEAWESFGAHVYESDGRDATHLYGRWHIKDLIDTRRTARSSSDAAQKSTGCEPMEGTRNWRSVGPLCWTKTAAEGRTAHSMRSRYKSMPTTNAARPQMNTLTDRRLRFRSQY